MQPALVWTCTKNDHGGVPFQAIVGKGFISLIVRNYGNLSFWSVIEPKKDKQVYFVDVKETR